MIIVKLGELKGIVNSLNEIMGEKLPVKVAYSFGKLARAIKKEVDLYEEGRLKLINRYCARDENLKPIVKSGNYDIADKEAFGKEITELANIETKIDFTPITLDKFGDIQISPAAMIGLYMFIGDQQ